MSRIRNLFLAVPALLVGGLLFPQTTSYADVGSRGGYWPASDGNLVAQAEPHHVPHVPPVPPTYPTSPMPPAPPPPPMRRGSGVSVSIHDGKVQIEGVKDLVASHIQQALETVRNMKDLPPDVREKLVKRLEKVQGKLERRLSRLDATDLDRLGDELGQMGDEIGQEMDEFGKEMEKYGEKYAKQYEKFGKDFGKNFHGNIHSGNDSDSDSDDSDDVVAMPDADDDGDIDDAVQQLGDLHLDAQQREAIQRLRADSERQVATAKRALEQASGNLKRAIDNAGSSDQDISRAIDAVTQQEAAIRKARILAWHNVRRMLDDGQRQRVQTAAKHHR